MAHDAVDKGADASSGPFTASEPNATTSESTTVSDTSPASLGEQVWRLDHIREAIIEAYVHKFLVRQADDPDDEFIQTWVKLQGVVNVAQLDRSTYMHVRKATLTDTAVHLAHVREPFSRSKLLMDLDYSIVKKLFLSSPAWLSHGWKPEHSARLHIFDWFPNLEMFICGGDNLARGDWLELVVEMRDRVRKQVDCMGDGKTHLDVTAAVREFLTDQGACTTELPAFTVANTQYAITPVYNILAQRYTREPTAPRVSKFTPHESWAGKTIQDVSFQTTWDAPRVDLDGLGALLEACNSYNVPEVSINPVDLENYRPQLHGPLQGGSIKDMGIVLSPVDWETLPPPSDTVFFMPTPPKHVLDVLHSPVWTQFSNLKKLRVLGMAVVRGSPPALEKRGSAPYTANFPHLDEIKLGIDITTDADESTDTTPKPIYLPEIGPMAEALARFGDHCKIRIHFPQYPGDPPSPHTALKEQYQADLTRAVEAIRRRRQASVF